MKMYTLRRPCSAGGDGRQAAAFIDRPSSASAAIIGEKLGPPIRSFFRLPPAALPRAVHLEAGRVVLRPAGPLQVDVAAFEAAAAEARRTAEPAAYEVAIARYSGKAA